MISAADDYPLHQSSRPFRDPGYDRDLYDRFFFNGYRQAGPERGDAFFAVAFGSYPGRNVVDAAFSVIVEGVQHNVRASRIMNDDRLDLRCETVTVEIVKPLETLRVVVDDPDAAVTADLTFTARSRPFEEPQYRFAPGHRTVMDITRMTQNGTWSGYFQVGTRRIELSDDTWWGCRDRSWGLRRVGEAPPPGAPDGSPHGPGFYWLWAPLNLSDECLIIDVNEYPNGRRWHENASVIPLGLDGTPDEGTYTYDIDWKPGTRHAKGFRADLTLGSGRRETITLVPHLTFFMSGLGYTHPTWGHGMWVGPAAHTYDAIDLATANEAEMIHNHVQILCDVIRSSDGAVGTGVLEMMIIGPHAPSGFTGILDVHP